ncbi:MAG: MerR family transcriptional regulator [Bacteroidota bacterium]|nr:MerR family transcriptional regulator [Bacteroidota bacterium]
MFFTIKDIENLSGIKAHTIRIWEQRYSLIKPKRSDTNIRYYTNDDLKTILNVALLNKCGYKISHIDKMSPETIAENVLTLSTSAAKDLLMVNQLLESMIDFDVAVFENIIDKNIAASGFESTVLKIIFPFLEKVGILWVTNHIHPAQEHLVSNVIRQKIIAGIDKITVRPKSTRQVCLFLPEGEYHELALLLVCYLLKKKGIRTIYLGAHTPFRELEAITEHKDISHLYTHVTSASQGFNFEKFLLTLSKNFNKYLTIISGRPTNSYTKKIPPKIIFKRSLSEVRDFIDSLE